MLSLPYSSLTVAQVQKNSVSSEKFYTQLEEPNKIKPHKWRRLFGMVPKTMPRPQQHFQRSITTSTSCTSITTSTSCTLKKFLIMLATIMISFPHHIFIFLKLVMLQIWYFTKGKMKGISYLLLVKGIIFICTLWNLKH